MFQRPPPLTAAAPRAHRFGFRSGWLAGFLAKVPWAFLLVSHDRWLLGRCVSRVVEVRHRRLHCYTGGFSSYLDQRALQAEQQQTA
ncbi:MAG: ABC transporter ATP-binding protein, partial [bacterium]|nr:ABC transporter ATP-binding protein [bacterium]